MSKKKEGTSSKKKVVSSVVGRKHVVKKTHIATAPPEHAFVTLDGKRLHSILELAHALDQMADHVYTHHVTHEKNDFATWIKDIFNEHDLAKALSETKDKHHTHIIVLRHVVNSIPDSK